MAQLHAGVKAGALVLVLLGAGFGGLYATGNLPWGGQAPLEAEQAVLSAPAANLTAPKPETIAQAQDEVAPESSDDVTVTTQDDPVPSTDPASEQAQARPEKTPEPETTPVSQGPDAPSFDVVRVEPDGSALIAGRAPLGSAVEILVDGEVVAQVEANHNGSFASFLTLDPSDGPRVLSLLSRRDGQGTLSEDQVIIAPIQSPVTVLAEDVGSETRDEAGAEDEVSAPTRDVVVTAETDAREAEETAKAVEDASEATQQVAVLDEEPAEPQEARPTELAEIRPQSRPVTQVVEPVDAAADPVSQSDAVETAEQAAREELSTQPDSEQASAPDVTVPVAESETIDTAEVAPVQPVIASEPVQDKARAEPDQSAALAEAEGQMPQLETPPDQAPATVSETANAVAASEPAQAEQQSAPVKADTEQAQDLVAEGIASSVEDSETLPDASNAEPEKSAAPVASQIADLRPQLRPEGEKDPQPETQAEATYEDATAIAAPAEAAKAETIETAALSEPVDIAPAQEEPNMTIPEEPNAAAQEKPNTTVQEEPNTAAQKEPNATVQEEPNAPAVPNVAQATAKPEASPVPDVSTSAAGLAAPSADPVPASGSGAVAVLRAGADGIELLQPANPQRPAAMDRISLDTISYSQAGDVLLAGRAKGQSVVRIYLDNRAIADLGADESGQWKGTLDGVAPGIYTLRLDELSAQGQVTSRLETPFKREAPSVLQAPAPEDPARPAPLIRAVTVQTGDTLWAISRERYGEGTLYVRVFEANRDSIRDPDLIYPGQVFAIPD